MGNLSEHFNREEFACKCGKCGQDQVDYELVVALERLRRTTGAAVHITSGNRCPTHNANEGGAKRSKHLYSIAADIKVDTFSPQEIYNILDGWYPDTYGIIIYRSWVHFDVRKTKYRNDKR